jgi:CRISPR/Cas system-associated protein Csm6
MGRASRANPKSWENQTPEQRKEGIERKRIGEAQAAAATEYFRRLFFDRRKQRAAAMGATPPPKGQAG